MSNAYTYLDGYYKTSYYTIVMQVIRSLSLHSTGVVFFMRHAPSTFLSTTDAADAAAAGGENF